jgi:hypothetical protein
MVNTSDLREEYGSMQVLLLQEDRRVLILKDLLTMDGDIFTRLNKVSKVSLWHWLKLDVSSQEIGLEDIDELIKYAIGLCNIEV